MKQTAVEWLIEQLNNGEYNPLQKNGYSLAEERLYNQAKEMEKQQIIDANRDGVDMVIDNAPFITGEQYYNETFNKKQS